MLRNHYFPRSAQGLTRTAVCDPDLVCGPDLGQDFRAKAVVLTKSSLHHQFRAGGICTDIPAATSAASIIASERVGCG